MAHFLQVIFYANKPKCPKCSSSKTYKNGKVKGVQRYKCKECHYQFTRTTPRGRSAADKALAVTLYLMGVSMNAIGRLLQVSTPAVLSWIRKFALDNYEKPEPAQAIVVELDEMWHFLNSKKINSGSGKPIVVIPVDSLTGSAEGVIRLPSKN